MTRFGPNLSHWPGNRTPGKWKADLSTGIALRFARASEAEQAEFLGDAELVLNDHYDTDGFGALLAVLRPEVAIPREEVLLAAAATGDFGTWQTWRGFAIDRIVANLAAPASPVRDVFAGISDADALSLRRYEWLLANAATVLDEPRRFAPLWVDEMTSVQEEIDAGLRGDASRRRWDDLDFAVVMTVGPLHRMTLNTIAGAHRVLHVRTGKDGTRFRYHDRTESWFDLSSFHTLPRRDLRPLAARLGELEPPLDGSCWMADPPTEPIPELYFGAPSPQAYGHVTRELSASHLSADRVIAAFVAFFANGTPRAE